ncbi:MAG: capsule assembly Wzi family protein, partial [Gemmatimonadales bacterium]
VTVSGGFELRSGPLTVTIDPIFFRAENQAFALQTVPSSVRGAPYGDPVSPGGIDLPQRFGSAAYQRLDPGQSTIRLDMFGVTVGASTANEIWGPAITSPIVLGNNAAGIPRVFAGTDRPANIGIGRLQLRWFAGQLTQSAWSPIDTTGGKLFTTGLIAVFQPRGLENVEIGFGRLFELFWPQGGVPIGDLTLPFQTFYYASLHQGKGTPGGAPDHQIASAFVRILLPHSGMEIYGEYGRDDHSLDTRDLLLEPDHISAYTFGVQRAWVAGDSSRTTALRLEFSNGRVTDLSGGRGEILFYSHSPIAQGNTQDGQLLGSPAIRGGGGGIIAVDRYSSSGRVTFSLSRTDQATETEGGLGFGAETALMVDVLRFRRGFDLSGQFGVIFGTGVQGSTDRAQFHASLGARFPIGF